MLAEASVSLAERSASLTSIARTEASLSALHESVSPFDCRHRPIAQDYNDIANLRSVVQGAIRDEGPAQLIVAWIHEGEGPVLPAICEVATVPGHSTRLIHVLGSAAADPARSLDALANRFVVYPELVYQQVVLGFRVESGGARWLSDSEISAGVIEAAEIDTSRCIVGETRPWSRRP